MNQIVLKWLQEEDNPPVRYLTLTKLMDKPEKDPEVMNAKGSLMEYKVTQAILDQGKKFWNLDEKAYWKYTGKYWQVIFLGHLLANGKDPRISNFVEDLIEKRQWINDRGGQCLTANMLSAFIRLGFADHPIVIQEIENLAQRTLEDKGVKCDVMDYSLLSRCYMSTPKLLACFGLVSEENRSSSAEEAIFSLQNNLISNEIHKYVPGNNKKWQTVMESAPKRAELLPGQTVKQWMINKNEEFLNENGLGDRQIKPGWLRFGFPLHYNSDILEAMYVLAYVNTPMSLNLEEPLRIIKEKATTEGHWILENSLNGKMLADVEEKGKPSKWITFFSMFVINHFESFATKQKE